MVDFLHIYGQFNPHDSVSIIGSRQDLVNLMATINKALYSPTKSSHYTSDGEGFDVYVVALEEPRYDGQDLTFPYADGFGCIERMNQNRISPWYVWKGLRKYFGLKP